MKKVSAPNPHPRHQEVITLCDSSDDDKDDGAAARSRNQYKASLPPSPEEAAALPSKDDNQDDNDSIAEFSDDENDSNNGNADTNARFPLKFSWRPTNHKLPPQNVQEKTKATTATGSLDNSASLLLAAGPSVARNNAENDTPLGSTLAEVSTPPIALQAAHAAATDDDDIEIQVLHVKPPPTVALGVSLASTSQTGRESATPPSSESRQSNNYKKRKLLEASSLTTTVFAAAKRPAKASLSSSLSDSDDDDDDFIWNTAGTFTKLNPKTPQVMVEQARYDCGNNSTHQPHVATATSRPLKDPVTISLLDDDDDNYDHELEAALQASRLEASAVAQKAFMTESQNASTLSSSVKKTPTSNPYLRCPRQECSATTASGTIAGTTTSSRRLITPTTAGMLSSSNPYKKTSTTTPTSLFSSQNSTPNSSQQPWSRTPTTPTIKNPYLRRSTTSVSSANGSNSTSETFKTSSSSASWELSSFPPSTATPRPLLSYPRLLDQTKSYPDVRAQYCLAFWKEARKLTQHSYNCRRLDRMASRIVHLALEVEFAIRSPDEYCQRRLPGGGVTWSDTKVQELKQLLDKQDVDRIKTPPGVAPSGNTITNTFRQGPQRTFYTIPEAALVAMLDFVAPKLVEANGGSLDALMSNQGDDDSEQSLTAQQLLSEKDYWLSFSDLFPMIDERLKQTCPHRLTRREDPDNGVAHYLDASTRNAEYLQLVKLTSVLQDHELPYLRRHSVKGKPHMELTRRGFRKALHVRNRLFPAPNGHYRTSNLYKDQVQAKYQGICLAVDRKEGGGEAHNLHKMCNKLDMVGLPYFVGTLSIGDYCFFSGEKLCPLLVERKSIEDIAISVSDGRWESQKKRMYRGQYVFGYSTCRMAYIIEGKEETQQVTGGYIGHRKHNVSREKLDELIKNLETEGFDVLRTSSPENSMFELARWATRVLQEAQGGGLEIKYTYQEFKDLVKKIPPQVDFSRLAKDAMQTRKAAAREREQQANRIVVVEEKENDGMLQPTVLDAKLKGIATKKTAPTENKYLKASNKSSVATPGALVVNAATASSQNSDTVADYSKWTTQALQQQCVDWGLSKSGAKATLIERLQGPRRPRVLMDREAQNLYAPKRHDIGANALLVGLVLEQCKHGAAPDPSFKGCTKDELYVLAEGLNITKNPFSGGTTQTGPYLYDGWSNMRYLTDGDPPLVCRVKGGRYKLSTCGPISGVPIAKAVHRWCHAHNKCSCQDLGYVYNKDDWN